MDLQVKTLPIHSIFIYTTVNWEENGELWVHGFQIHRKFLVPKSVNWEVTLPTQFLNPEKYFDSFL